MRWIHISSRTPDENSLEFPKYLQVGAGLYRVILIIVGVYVAYNFQTGHNKIKLLMAAHGSADG
jgi:hypothetical protein